MEYDGGVRGFKTSWGNAIRYDGKEESVGNDNDRFGVLLSADAWELLGEALDPYKQEGRIGKYLYCHQLTFDGGFASLSFTPDQVDGRIKHGMTIMVPARYIIFVAHSTDEDGAAIGFSHPRAN